MMSTLTKRKDRDNEVIIDLNDDCDINYGDNNDNNSNNSINIERNNKGQLDPEWDEVTREGPDLVSCKHCKKQLFGRVARIRLHFSVFNTAGRCEVIFPKKQSYSIKNCFSAGLSASQIDEFHKKISQFIYTSGTSFNKLENKDFLAALKVLHPNVTLPSRKTLSDKLLTESYNEMNTKINKIIKQKGNYSCLAIDSTTNTIGIPIINFMIVVDGKSTFYCSKEGGSESHTHQVITHEVSDVMNSVGVDLVVGMCTDNAANNKAAWAELSVLYPKKFFYGCVCHELNLVIKDFMNLGTLNDFTNLKYLQDNASDVVSFFKNHHEINKQVRELQIASKTIALTQTCKFINYILIIF